MRGNTRSCITCRSRKVYCDKTRPNCRKCSRSGWNCQGYDEPWEFVFVAPILDRSRPLTSKLATRLAKTGNSIKVPPQTIMQRSLRNVNPAAENSIQILANFLESYMPQNGMSPGNMRETSSSWIYHIPDYHGRWTLFDSSLLAMCLAYMGNSYHDHHLTQQSRRYYSSVLEKLRTSCSATSSSDLDCKLATCMILAMYEMFQCTVGGIQSWVFHVRGATKFLEMKGPSSEGQSFDLSLFRRIRTMAIYDAYVSRKAIFLASPEWLGLSESPYDQLLDVLVCLPGLLEQLDHLKAEDSTTIQCLLDQSQLHAHQLIRWYSKFQLDQPSPLFWVDDSEFAPYFDLGTDMNDIIKGVVNFQSPYIAQVILLYWFGEIMQHIIMITLSGMPGFKKQSASGMSLNGNALSNNMCEDVIKRYENAGDHFANKICQAIQGWHKNSLQGYGFQVAMVPLWAAKSFFHGRSERKRFWCETVLKSYKSNGFPVGEALGLLDLQLEW